MYHHDNRTVFDSYQKDKGTNKNLKVILNKIHLTNKANQGAYTIENTTRSSARVYNSQMPSIVNSMNDYITEGGDGPDIVLQECRLNNILTPGFGNQTFNGGDDSVFRNITNAVNQKEETQ